MAAEQGFLRSWSRCVRSWLASRVSEGTLWRAPGKIVVLTYLVILIVIVFTLIEDSLKVEPTSGLSIFEGLESYLVNSLAVAVPAAILCIGTGTVIAYRLRFLSPLKAIVPVLVLLAPFFTSPIAIYFGFKLIFGAGRGTLILGLAFRYLPIAVILLTLPLYSLPGGSRVTLENFGRSGRRLFIRIAVPIMLPTLLLLFVFLLLIMPLDVTATSIAGGGNVQTFGNLIWDYSHTRDNQEVSSLFTLMYLWVAVLVIGAMLLFALRRVRPVFGSEVRAGESFTSARTIWLNGPFLLYVCMYVAILVVLLSQGRFEAGTYSELGVGMQKSLAIIGPTSLIAMVMSLFVCLLMHLRRAKMRSRLLMTGIGIGLAVPPILPGVLAGRMAAVAQGAVEQHGGDLSISFWYLFFFGTLPILIMLGHPVFLEWRMPKVAANYRIEIGDYVSLVVLPATGLVVCVAGGLFAALAMSDSLIVRYIGGSTKTLGLVLANHQEGSWLYEDYIFLGGLGVATVVCLLLAGLMIYSAQRGFWSPERLKASERKSVNRSLTVK